ncbi:MAG: PorV/PorQ family protein [Candidatus Latescibacterota bacterium]
MKHGITLAAVFITCLLVIPNRPLNAGSYGTELPFVSGTGGRSSGMGLAYTSMVGDPSVQFFNPAALAETKWKQLEIFRTVLFDSKSLYHTLSYSHPTTQYGTLAISILRLDISGIEERDVTNQLLSSDMKNSQTRVLLGYAMRLHSAISAGLNLKIDNQSFGNMSGSGVGFDAGFLSIHHPASIPYVHEIRGGLAIQNLIEPSVKLDQESVPDPMRLVFGLSATSEYKDLSFVSSVDLVNPRYSPFSFRFGQEVQFLDHFALRIGMDGTTPTYGFGVRYNAFMFDYAYRSEDLGSNHRLSLAMSFGPSINEQKDIARLQLERQINDEISRKMEKIEQAQLKNTYHKADSLYEIKDYLRAIDYYEITLQADPDNQRSKVRINNARYQINLESGRRYIEIEDYLSALYHLRQALSFAQNDSTATQLIQSCEQALSQSRDQELLIEQMLKKSIDSYAEQNYRKALLGFEEILHINPSHSMAKEYMQKTSVNIENIKQGKILKAKRLAGNNDFDGAIKTLEEALPYSNDNKALLAEISAYQEQKQLMLAAAAKAQDTQLPDVKSVKSQIPTADISVLEDKYRSGMRHFEAGNFKEATQSFLELWTLDPGYHNVSTLLTRTYLLMGMQHYSKEQYEEAVNIWEKALKIDPNNTKAKRYLIKTKGEMEKLGGVGNG